MKFVKTGFEGVYVLEPRVFEDDRGYFLETFRQEHFENRGLDVNFVQDNCSSSQKNTVRGLHYQIGEAAQAKLVMVSRGLILDVAVDLRVSSKTFGKSMVVELSEQNHKMFYMPAGFAHGFAVKSEQAVVHYKCSNYYRPEMERGVKWNDPDLEIQWDVDEPIVSEKDQNQPLFKDLKPEALF